MGARRSGGEGAAACGYTSRITITLTCGWGRWSGGGVGLPSAHLEVMEADLVAAEGDRRIGRGRVDGVVTQHDPLSEAFGIREDPARDHIGIARRGKDADVAHVTFRVPCEQFGSIPFRPRPVTGSDGVQPPASPTRITPPASPHPHHPTRITPLALPYRITPPASLTCRRQTVWARGTSVLAFHLFIDTLDAVYLSRDTSVHPSRDASVHPSRDASVHPSRDAGASISVAVRHVQQTCNPMDPYHRRRIVRIPLDPHTAH